jgi:hypothetical protein
VLSGEAKIVRVHLDPTEREFHALFDNLDRHWQSFFFYKKKESLVPWGQITNIARRARMLEIPIARRRVTHNGHELALARASHDQAPNDATFRLAVTVMPR